MEMQDQGNGGRVNNSVLLSHPVYRLVTFTRHLLNGNWDQMPRSSGIVDSGAIRS